MVAMRRQSAKPEGLRDVLPWLGTDTGVKLAPASVDLAILMDVHHELAYPHGC
ncbi:MAG: hypothetical protein ABW220_00940 [Burkholderiaceae bacterium]